jgi:hypothetical protein
MLGCIDSGQHFLHVTSALQVLRPSDLMPNQGATFFQTNSGLPGLAFTLVPGIIKEIGLMASHL